MKAAKHNMLYKNLCSMSKTGLVRRSQKMTTEWGLDNHRQIFIINIADLIMALTQRKENDILIEICLHAILKICVDYQGIQIYGSYEPLTDMFELAQNLEHARFTRESKIAFKMLAFLDANTQYISHNKNVDLVEIFKGLQPELIIYCRNQREEVKGKAIRDVFENSIWY